MRRRVCITVSDQILAFIEENDFQKSAFFEAAALFFIASLGGKRSDARNLVGPRGFEPRTSRLSGGRSDQAEPRAQENYGARAGI